MKSTSFSQFGPHRDLRRNQVDLAIDERRQQHVARQRHEDHMDLVGVAGLEVLVQPFLDELSVVVRHAARHALVNEVERAIEGHADPHEPPLDHLVEVAFERLEDSCRARPGGSCVSSSEGSGRVSASAAAASFAADVSSAGAAVLLPPHAVSVTTTPTSSAPANSSLAVKVPPATAPNGRSARSGRSLRQQSGSSPHPRACSRRRDAVGHGPLFLAAIRNKGRESDLLIEPVLGLDMTLPTA